MGQPQLQEKPAETTATPTGEPPLAAVPDDAPKKWVRPKGLTTKGWAILAGAVLVFQLPLIARALRGQQPVTVSIPYSDDFSDPQTVRKNFWSTGGLWRVINGELYSPGVKNNPLWLQGSLPRDVAVEFDVRPMGLEGDVKVEIFGDGLNHASGYVLIHGGWNNRMSIIARLDEHGLPLPQLHAKAQRKAQELKMSNAGLVETGIFRPDTRMRVEGQHQPVQVGRTYRWRIERRGSLLRWFIDGQPYMEFEDPFPLEGKGHDRFGFSSWEASLYFDNLRVEPL